VLISFSEGYNTSSSGDLLFYGRTIDKEARKVKQKTVIAA
jgi:hypothetical protein